MTITPRLIVQFVSPLLVSLMVVAMVYHPSLSAPFIFDDIGSIVDDSYVQNYSFSSDDFWSILGPRGLTNFTFGLNHYFGGNNPVGYHLVNLFLHGINGLLVYLLILLLIQRVQRRPNATSWFNIPSSQLIAITAALWFIVHPVQTMAVNYSVQRLALLATLWYLVALIAYLKFRMTISNKSRYGWGVLTLVATGLAFLSKEISATLPIAIIGLEFFLFTKTWHSFARKLPIALLGLLLVMVIPAFYLGLVPFLQWGPLTDISFANRLATLDLGSLFIRTSQTNSFQYALTSWPVIATYLRLALLPVKLTLDYDFAWVDQISEPRLWASALLVTSLLATSIWLWRIKHRLPSLGLLFFFLAISIESSIIALPDPIVEYRMYLPMVGLAMCFGYLVDQGLRLAKQWDSSVKETPPPFVLVIIVALIILLAYHSYQRNHLWADEVALWQDTVNKSPGKARPYNQLGIAYLQQGTLGQAETVFKQALAIEPDNAFYWNNLGNVLTRQKKYTAAEEALKIALTHKPDHAGAFNNLGNIAFAENDLDQAIDYYQQSLALMLTSDSYANLADTYYQRGDVDTAIATYQEGIRLFPSAIRLYLELGDLHHEQEQHQAAEKTYQTALTVQTSPTLYAKLGLLYARTKRPGDAIKMYELAVKNGLGDPDWYNNLGVMYLQTKNVTSAIAAFEAGLRLDPTNADLTKNLNLLHQEINTSPLQ